MINIYSISLQGNVEHYAHFFYCVLIPFIYYQITDNEIPIHLNFVMKIGKFIKFFDQLFNKYIITNKFTIEASHVYENYDLYVNHILEKDKSQFFLESYDIFDQTFYKYVQPNLMVDKNELKNLQTKYYLSKNPKKFDSELNRKRKILYYTQKYQDLKKIRPYIIDFFKNKIRDIKKSPYKIILINRKFPT